jgi:hypothetical protein
MSATVLPNPADRGRWGEKLLIVAVAPGAFAAAVLGIGLALGYFQWQPNFGPLEVPLAYAAISTPMLEMLGSLTLVGGALVAPFVPGRAKRKWGILLLGTIAWGAAFYWLHVPGLIELP